MERLSHDDRRRTSSGARSTRNRTRCSATTAPELGDLLTECAPATTWRDRIREWIDDIYDDAQAALVADALVLTLVALERLVASRFRAAAAQETAQMPWHMSADPFGVLVTLRGLSHVQLITLLAHPDDGSAIVGSAATHDRDELCRLLLATEAVGPIQSGSASQEAA